MKSATHLTKTLLKAVIGPPAQKISGAIPTFVKESLDPKKLPRTSGILACLGLSCSIGSGCGILGDKDSASKTLSQNDSACLDNMGPLMENFVDGNVDEGEWRSTWNCVDNTIDLFKTFIQGSSANTYSPDDLRALTQRFLFSKGQVTTAFISSLLSVKSSLLGGSDQNLTKDELENYRGLVRFLRDETSKLIPYLKNRKQNPTSDNLRAFADAIETFGNHFADYLNTSKNPLLTLDKSVQFMRELSALGLKADPDRIEVWTRFILDLKVLIVKGSTDGIAGPDWTSILKMGFKVGGSFIAYMDAVGEDPLFQNEMIDRVHAVLKNSLSLWGGNLPFSQLDHIFDHTPNDFLPRLADDFRAGVKALLKPRVKAGVTYRPGLATLFNSKIDTGIDAQAIQRLVDAYHLASRGNYHLINIYSDTKEDLYPSDFEARARTYESRLGTGSSDEVERLITIARRYPGLHPAGSPEILFSGQEKHSLNNLKRMNWYEVAATLLLDSYGTSSDEYGKAAVLGDLTRLIDDINPMLFAFEMVNPLKTNLDKKRFREANLFMPNGNGDDKMNLPETAVYIAYLFSSGRLSSRVENLNLNGANPCPTLGWDVPLKEQVYDIHCFRDHWLSNFKDEFQNMPRMMADYNAMSQAEKDHFYYDLEFASKTTGYDDTPITAFDLSSFGGLPHFAEAVMQKFDRDGDGALNRSETLDYVFPVFKRELGELSGIKIDFLNKAVLLYLMQYGKQPGIGDLLGWALGLEFLKDFHARRIRIYDIFCALSPPGPADPISQTPPPGAGFASTPLGFVANSLVKGLVPPDTSVNSTPARSLASALIPSSSVKFDLSQVDPEQLEGYNEDGPVIDPNSPYKDALEVLPQDL